MTNFEVYKDISGELPRGYAKDIALEMEVEIWTVYKHAKGNVTNIEVYNACLTKAIEHKKAKQKAKEMLKELNAMLSYS